VPLIRGVIVVHMNKNAPNFKVKAEQKYVTCNFFQILIEDSVLECPLDDGDNKKIANKVLPSIRMVFVVHMNKNGANFKVKRSKSK